MPSTASSGSLAVGAVGEVGFAGAEVGLELQQQQGGDAAESAEGEEEAVLADYTMLPEECWMDVLQRLGVKELCYMSRVSR
jgi:hypothetical protein